METSWILEFSNTSAHYCVLQQGYGSLTGAHAQTHSKSLEFTVADD